MGFLRNLFRKKKRPSTGEYDWENIESTRDEVDFEDAEQRTGYVMDYLEQMGEAAKETDLLSGEYALVTSYLKDMEEIDALDGEAREEIQALASKLSIMDQEREQFRDRESRMSDSEYHRMLKLEDEMEEGIERIRKEEKYNGLVKQDLRRLDRERHAYEYRREELDVMRMNLRGVALIFLVALVICVIMLLVLQFAFGMNTYIGYLIAILAAAVGVTVVCAKYTDADKESARVEHAINRLIQLQNKVKIRYVNNVHLLDYLYMKYNTDSADKLKRQWQMFQKEKEERRQFAETESKVDYYANRLVEKLSDYRISDPGRWVRQTKAILDPREMVEIRHELILRRQALREQLDYNQDLARVAKAEIMSVAEQYPAYAEEILNMVDEYECN